MMKFKKIVIVMMSACLLLGVGASSSKQVEENKSDIIEMQICEGIVNPNDELL